MQTDTTERSALPPQGSRTSARALAYAVTAATLASLLVPSAAEAKRPRPTTTTTAPTTTTTPAPTTTTTPAPTTTTTAVVGSPVGYPTTPPAQICGSSMLNGPTTAPAGAIVVPPGDNSGFFQNRPAGTTFWFQPGVHTLGTSPYGQIIPADNMTFIGAPGAILDGSNVNKYAFTQHATNVKIRYLTIQNFGAPGDNNNEGVVNHDGGSGWTIEYNTIKNNAGAGVFLGSHNLLRYNCIRDNGQYGFSMYKPEGLQSITIDHNEIAGNNTYDWESKIVGCGCTGGGKFWDARNVTVTNNWVHHNKSVGLWADTNDIGFLFEGNYINDNDAEGIFYEISYNARIANNTLIRNAIVKGRSFAARNDNFPIVAIYLSESGGDSRVNGGVYSTLEISGNNLVDNWGGIALWENADRFCNSPANTSGGYCTAVNPSQSNFNTCVAGTINNPPHYSDCRWKTQNVSVHDNQFKFSRANVACTTTGCGQQAILSNWGTYPSWSPYQGRAIQDAITFNQNNRFANNTYVGDWRFITYETGNAVPFSTWQAAPYGQDAGSSLTPSSTTQPSTTTTTAPSPTSTSTSTTLAPTTTVAPTTTTTPPTASRNALDADTSGLEGSTGAWAPWFSANVSRSAAAAHTGTNSLRVDVTAPYGWGVQLNNYPGFATTAGSKTIGFWGLLGAGPSTGLTMSVKWLDASGAALQTDTVAMPALGTTWQHASAAVTAPSGTARVWVELVGNSPAGTTVFLDDIVVSG